MVGPVLAVPVRVTRPVGMVLGAVTVKVELAVALGAMVIGALPGVTVRPPTWLIDRLPDIVRLEWLARVTVTGRL